MDFDLIIIGTDSLVMEVFEIIFCIFCLMDRETRIEMYILYFSLLILSFIESLFITVTIPFWCSSNISHNCGSKNRADIVIKIYIIFIYLYSLFFDTLFILLIYFEFETYNSLFMSINLILFFGLSCLNSFIFHMYLHC